MIYLKKNTYIHVHINRGGGAVGQSVHPGSGRLGDVSIRL